MALHRPLGFIVPEAILPDLKVKTKTEAIRAMTESLGAALGFSAEQIEMAFAALLKREEFGTTGIGNGLGLPHCTLPFVNELVGGLALCREGVNFDSLDRKPAHFLVLLLAPAGDPGARLRALERTSHFVRRPRAYQGDLFRCRTAEEIVAFFRDAEDNPTSPVSAPTPSPAGATMQRISREQARKNAFDWRDEPLMRVKCGESFEIETYDASTGYFKTEDDKAVPAKRPGFDRSPPLANPIGGPVWLEGAERGDCLVVTIEDILVDDYSWIAIGPRRGPLGESTRWPELSADYTTRILRHTPGPSGTTRDGTMRFNDRIQWPVTPFIGTLGVAPDREVTTSLDGQGEWGGNLDIRDVSPGNKIFLPILHEGARFYLGDVHASQGDTEFTGTAAETKATVRVKLELIKGKRIPWMRIEKPNSIVSIFATRPMEAAVETATFNLMDWLITEHRFTPTDAYCLVSTCPDFRINIYQMCKIGKLGFVAGAEIPKRYL
jgi:acetamidase/formamidase/mannitol/fructose-specific phosphotransferase system IIA component (Ntr-type)